MPTRSFFGRDVASWDALGKPGRFMLVRPADVRHRLSRFPELLKDTPGDPPPALGLFPNRPLDDADYREYRKGDPLEPPTSVGRLRLVPQALAQREIQNELSRCAHGEPTSGRQQNKRISALCHLREFEYLQDTVTSHDRQREIQQALFTRRVALYFEPRADHSLSVPSKRQEPPMYAGEVTSESPEFELEVEVSLKEFRTDNDRFSVLPHPGGTFGQDRVFFEIETNVSVVRGSADDALDSMTISVQTQDGKTLYEEEISQGSASEEQSKLLKAGDHRWAWDGYDQQGILDSRVLRGALKLRVAIEKQGKRAEDTLSLNNDGDLHGKDYIEVRVDREAQKVEVEVFLNPFDAKRGQGFERLSAQAAVGIGRHWSRDKRRSVGEGVNIGGVIFEVSTRASIREKDGLMMKLITDDRPLGDAGRSYNLGGDNSDGQAIIPMTVYFLSKHPFPEVDFQHTAAHEFGHSVLRARGGRKFSWGHKGTSTQLGDIVDETPYVPAKGEVDLMEYQVGYLNETDTKTRSVASEEDVKRLISLAEVDFDA